MIAIIGTGSANSYELSTHSVDATFSHQKSFLQDNHSRNVLLTWLIIKQSLIAFCVTSYNQGEKVVV